MGNVLTESSVIYNGEDSIERNQKEQEYLDYINLHRSNVKKAFYNYFKPLLDKEISPDENMPFSVEEFKSTISNMDSRIEEHDQSKFGDNEFDGYRMKYYPTKYELSIPDFDELSSDRVEECWRHHYLNNAHHPRYWYNEATKESKDMNLESIIEMICDWLSFTYWEKGKYKDYRLWWENDQEAQELKTIMTPDTIRKTEYILYNIIYS